MCHSRCRVLVHSEDGRLVKIEEDRSYPLLDAALPPTRACLRFHGGYGYLDDYPVERFYRAAKLLELYEGTKEGQKLLIGRRILGV